MNPLKETCTDTAITNPSNLHGPRFKFVKDNNMGNNNNLRRALSNIDPNVMEAALRPCVVNKREFLGKDMILGAKNSSAVVHRPITRNFAAQTLQRCSDKACHSATKNFLGLASQNSVGVKNYDTVDMEDFENLTSDVSVPMFVKHTEAILDDIDGVEEVEMEDVEEEEPVMDIDNGSLKDPLSVVEYVSEIYDHYKKTERFSCVLPNYMAHQPDINEKMRAILIDWLIEVHHKFELMEETLFLTVNLIDRFLERKIVVRKKLQLVGVTAMLLACKYEEVSVPVVEDFVVITDKAYTRQDVLDMEKLMVNTLQFNFSLPTQFVFMKRFLKAAQSNKKLEVLSHFIIELCLVESEMLKFSPSMLAAAAIYTAQCSLCKSRQWSRTSQWYTNYSEDQLLECSRLMVSYHQNCGKGKLTGVYRKYNTRKFGFAAKSEPADFLLLGGGGSLRS